jgi:hypothetical protein
MQVQISGVLWILNPLLCQVSTCGPKRPEKASKIDVFPGWGEVRAAMGNVEICTENAASGGLSTAIFHWNSARNSAG